jgi:hypothetical protein
MLSSSVRTPALSASVVAATPRVSRLAPLLDPGDGMPNLAGCELQTARLSDDAQQFDLVMTFEQV